MIDAGSVIGINARREPEEAIPDEAVQLAKEMGLEGRESIVARNYETLNKLHQGRRADAQTANSPVTRGMMADPNGSPDFKYVPDMIELEGDATPFFSYVGKKAEMGLAQQSGNQKIFDVMDRNLSMEEINALVTEEDRIQEEGQKLQPGGTMSYLAGETAQMAGQILGDEDVIHGLAAQAVGTAANLVLVPPVAAAGAITRTAGAAYTRVAMLTNIYQLETGGAYREYRNIEGPLGDKLDAETARYMAHSYGAISTVLEAVGFQKATGLSLLTKGALSRKAFAKKFQQAWAQEGGRKAIQDAVTTIAMGPAVEGFTEAVQSLTQTVIGSYGENQVGATTDWNKAADEAWQSFKVGAAASVIPAGVQAGVGLYLDKPLAKNAPAVAGSVLEGAAKSTGHDGNIHIDPEGAVILKQNMAVNKVDNPAVMAELDAAIAGGHTATVPINTWMAVAAGLDSATIAKHVTADPSQATAAESEAVSAAKADLKEEALPETIEESPVYLQRMDEQLKAGVSMQQAQYNAKIATLWAHQWARQMGIPVEQALADLTVGAKGRDDLAGRMEQGESLDPSYAARLQRAEEQGYDLPVFSGSTHDIKNFDGRLGNPESDWGAASYATTSTEDASDNYAGEGPDLTNRITTRTEQIEQDLLDLDDDGRAEVLAENGFTEADDLADVARAIAAKELKGGNEGVVYPLVIKSAGYAVIGGDNPTILRSKDYRAEAEADTPREDYSDEDAWLDAVQEREYELQDMDQEGLYPRVQDALQGAGVHDNAVTDVMTAVQGAMEDGELNLTDLDAAIREHVTDEYDDDGNLLPGGAISAQVLEALGYHGVIDNTVYAKFGPSKYGKGMAGLEPDTQHVITFPGFESNIRSTYAMFDPAKSGGTNILYQKGEGDGLVGESSRVGTALPKRKENGEDVYDHDTPDKMAISMEKILANPKVTASQATQIRAYDNFKPSRPDLTDEEVIREFKDHIKDNLLYLHDKMDPALRAQAKEWYRGARKQLELWMDEFGLQEQQIAAVMANLSPQKDWYQNISLAERALVIWTQHQDTVADKAMTAAIEKIFMTDAAGKPKKELSDADRRMLITWKNHGERKSLRQIEDETDGRQRDLVSAMFIRAYDEVNHPRHHRVIAPSGDMLDFAVSKASGERLGTGWNSFGEIGKAVAAMRDPDLTAISERLGTAHKVRNFYNNIVSPDSLLGEVTIDTHAVAAGLIKPLAGGSHEVAHNFGSAPGKDAPDTPPGIERAGPGGSGAQGISGTYGIFADAYREAAAERGLLPREMQSITWEEIRTIFTPEFKDDTNNQLAINSIWRQYKNGIITLGEAREAIEEKANVAEGRKPAWAGERAGAVTDGQRAGLAGSDSDMDAGKPTSTYREELPGSVVPGAEPGRAAGGRGSDGAGKGRAKPRTLDQPGDNDYRGQIQIGQGDLDGEFHITLTGNADASTFIHEFAHYALEKYRRAVADGSASDLIKEDYAKIQAFVGNTGEEITVAQHEQLAEAFESYFMEGKAPTPELQSTFQRLAKLILRVYKTIKTRVTMTPEIRSVFDHMLVGQAQVTTATAETIQPVEVEGIPLAMSDRIRKLAEDAYNAAQEIEMLRAMKSASKTQRAAYKEATQRHRKQVTEQVNAMPVYQVDSFLTTGESPRVQPRLWGTRLHPTYVKAILGTETIPESLKGRTSKDNPVDPEELAGYFGYETGEELLNDLINRQDKATLINQRTDAAVVAELGDPNLDPTVINAGMDAVHNDKLEAFLMAELEALTGQTMSKRVQSLAAQARAREILAGKKRSEMYPAKYYRASATQAGLAVEAARAGNHLKAADHIRSQILNHHLFRESTAQTTAFDKKVRKLNGYNGLKSMTAVRKGGAAYKNNPADIIPIVLGKLGIAPDVGGDPAALIRELSDEIDQMGLANPLVNMPAAAYVDTRLMTYDQLMAAAGNVQALVKIGKDANLVRLEDNRVKLDALIAEFTAQADTNLATKQWAREANEFQGTDPSVYRNFRKGLNTFHGWAMKLQSAVNILDGGDANGPFNRVFIAPLDRLEAQSRDLQIELGKQLEDIVGDLFQTERMAAEVSFLRKPMKRSSALMVVMNIGNETNLSRVVNGNFSDNFVPFEELNDWKNRIIQEAERLLEPSDIRVAFDIAKIMDRYGRLADVVEEVQGQILERVEPVPLTIHGIASPGYYFPIDYADKPAKPKKVGEQPMAVGAAAMANSAIKPRVKYAKGELVLETSTIPSHLGQVIHIETYYKHLMALDKIINNQDFATLITEKLGPSVYRMTFKDLLTVIATNGNANRFALQASKTSDVMLRRIRRNTTTFRLGFNFRSAALQLNGLFNSMALLGPANAFRGALSMLNNQNFRDLKSFTDAKSPMMKHRIETYNANMYDVLRESDGVFGGKVRQLADDYSQAAFIPMQSAQGVVDYLTWNTSYAVATKKGLADEQAVRFADDIVSRSQGTGGIHHRTPLESSGEIALMFNMHYSFWGTAYGQLASAVARLNNNKGGLQEALKVMQESAIYWAAPAFMMTAIGMMGDDDDDESLIAATALEMAKSMKATLPYVRAIPLTLFGVDDFAGQSPADILVGIGQRINAANGWSWSETRLIAQVAASSPTSIPLPADKLFLLVATTALMGKGEWEAAFGYFMGLKKWREVQPLLAG